MRQRKPLPEKIANAPELMLGLELYYSAFWDLTTCRQLGFGAAGAIPWSAIKDYAVAFDFDEEQAEDLFYFIRKMDNAYLEFYKPKEEKKPDGYVKQHGRVR